MNLILRLIVLLTLVSVPVSSVHAASKTPVLHHHQLGTNSQPVSPALVPHYDTIVVWQTTSLTYASLFGPYPTAVAYFAGRADAFSQVLDGTALADGTLRYRDLAQAYYQLYWFATAQGSSIASLVFLGRSQAFDQIADLMGEPPL